MSSWIHQNSLFSSHNRWLVQVPRIYSVWRKQSTPTQTERHSTNRFFSLKTKIKPKSKDAVKNFAEMLQNIFLPLFEVSNDPSSHPSLHMFLRQVSGLDSVDDESKIEQSMDMRYT